MIHLDHNGTTPLDARVRDAMVARLAAGVCDGNPSSAHAAGRAARRELDGARAKVRTMLGAAEGDRVVFTGSGSEAGALAVAGAVWAARLRRGGAVHAVASAVEHPATLALLAALRTREPAWFSYDLVPVGRDGVVPAAAVAAAVRPSTAVVSLMLANNETGALQPVAEVAAILREKETDLDSLPLLHVDAAQAVGRVPVCPLALGADLLSLAAHKLHGPKGVGALYVRAGVALAPQLLGGGQEFGLRAGTENVLGAAALGDACALIDTECDAAAMRAARDALRAGLRARLPDMVELGPSDDAERLPNTLAVSFHGVRGSALVAALADSVLISAGAACHAGGTASSHVLGAMGVPGDVAMGAVRLSTGRGTSLADAETACDRIASAVRSLQRT